MRILLLVLLLATPAMRAERTVGIGSVDRLRVDGAIEVRVTAGSSPMLRISGGRDAIETVETRVDGRTLTIRPGAGVWGDRRRAAEPVVVTLGTPSLAAIVSVAGARITATAAKGDRIDLSVSGTARSRSATAPRRR